MFELLQVISIVVSLLVMISIIESFTKNKISERYHLKNAGFGFIINCVYMLIHKCLFNGYINSFAFYITFLMGIAYLYFYWVKPLPKEINEKR